MRNGQLPVARRHDPMAGLDLPMVNFLRWVGALETSIFGVVTICFFHCLTPLAFCRIPVRDNLVRCVVASRHSAAESLN